MPVMNSAASRRLVLGILVAALVCAAARTARAEAMLELFNVNWAQLTQKMPEIAEAGYGSLWLPNPAKGNSGAYSYGYDSYDPFDLGGTNQQGTVATKWGTQAQLIQMVQTAHRFGIRVYFDNVMNHRANTVPGYPGSGTPTNYYPGLIPQDFHFQTVSGGYKNWSDVSDWCNVANVQNNPLLGLVDLANEPGTLNWNFGNNYGNTAAKPSFIRFPGRNDLYMNTNGPLLGAGWGGSGWRPFDGNGQPVAEDVSTYLCRAVGWTLWMTKCDGFRLDAVKHTPSSFFGNNPGASTLTDEPGFAGYTGMIQAMYDYTHGYGSNVCRNGYVENDGNRNSLFNTEASRNDAMIFGEHISPAPDFFQYINAGMRLCNQPLYNYLNNVFNNNSSLVGMDGRDFAPGWGNCDGSGNYSMAQGVNFPQTQDGSSCCPANQGAMDAYMFMHEGLPMVYSDGYNHNYSGGTPIVSYANYLGEFGDNSMPEIMQLHDQLARGGTNPRWSDGNLAIFERYDYREGGSASNQGVALFAMNHNSNSTGDITFDDGMGQDYDGYYGGISISNSKNQGLAVGFPPGSVLVQLASSSPTGGRAYQKLLVHAATNDKPTANGSIHASDPTQRLIYVGSQTIPSGGGAIELNLPNNAWVIYGYQPPEASRANLYTNTITLRQGGQIAQRITVTRTDGVNGDPSYKPLFPFKARGSVDAYGNVIGGAHTTNLAYTIDVPIVTNANFDIIVRSDSSCANALLKLDGGTDLNSQMALGPTNLNGKSSDNLAPTNFLDLRDNKPGYASDVFLGYEQTAFQYRDNPEKFAAKNTLSNTVVSLGAETYRYTVGGDTNTSIIVPGSGYGQGVGQTAAWIYHNPAGAMTQTNNLLATERVPLVPTNMQAADIYVQIGYANWVNTCFLYYTTDGSNPEGAFGTGKGTTQVVQAHWVGPDNGGPDGTGTKDWWKVTLPAQPDGTQVRYKIGTFYGGSGGSLYTGGNAAPVADGETTGAKYYGIYQAAITNFNPTTATVWLHNDLNPSNTVTGLQSGFHILRARVFLPRSGQSSVYGTFSQTFYYDGALPAGVIPYPANGATIGSTNYTVVVRCDSTVTGVDFNIQDSDTNNDDLVTGKSNGNGTNANGAPVYASATAVTPDGTLSAQYPNYTQEFRFSYASVPTSGSATINVRLKNFATATYSNRVTTLSATVNTLAPVQVVTIVNPGTNGTVLPYATNSVYQLQANFSPSLTSGNNTNYFTVKVNGTLLPQTSYLLRPTNSTSMNLKILFCNWTNPPAGASTIEVSCTNAIVPITDTRQIIFSPPLWISGLGGDNNQLVLWDSAPGLNYQVLATTNLANPFAPVSDIIPSQGSTTSFYDPNTAQQKFYQILLAP